MDNKYLAAILAVVSLAVGGVLGSQLAPHAVGGGQNITCTNGGAQGGTGGSGGVGGTGTASAPQSPGDILRYGAALSSTPQTILPNFASTTNLTVDSTVTSSKMVGLDGIGFQLGTNGGVVATGTRSSTTSTFDLSNGRTCLIVASATGVKQFLTFANGVLTSTSNCQ